MANHRSWLDIVVIAAASGCAFVSKAEVGRWPLVGWMAEMNDTILIERTRRSDVRGQADALRRGLERPKPVALFPEGGTNDRPGILPFRASLFAAVDPPPPGVAVWPALIDYGPLEGFVTWPDEEGAIANMMRLLGRAGSMPVRVGFLPAIDPAALTGRKAVAQAAQRALEAAAGLR
ncbi:MAG: 1-acyl-sn-glycerol-3-phosphate acyltransferase [Parafilimonas terrae]|nr:1-acyl-sn-glycerol-3-phosphate acyltransferase [Parafilimonas terrae]